MHIFLRLWRNRGWSMLDLDKALHALNITTFDMAGLGRVADLDRVQALTGAPLLEALSWWGPIDTFLDRPEKEQPVKSLYDRVYLNRAVDATAEERTFPLALDAARTALLNTVSWDDVRTLLQAALSIDADELALLLDETIDGVPNAQRVVTGTTATLEGLSAVYRHINLARRLALTVGELLGALRLVGLNPFDIANTGATIRFVETIQEIRDSDFSLIQLHYLLDHDGDAETSVGVTDEAIGQCLVEIRDGLARVVADYTVAADPVGEITAKYLAVLLDADAVAAVMTALQTEADAANRAELEAALTNNLGTLFTFDAAAIIALEVEQRFNAFVRHLAPYLRDTQSNAVVIEKVATFAARGLDSTQDLLDLRLKMTVGGRETFALAGLRDSPYTATTASDIVPDDDPEAFAALRRLHKAAMVLNTLGVEIDAQAWLFDVGVRNGLLNPLAVPIVSQPVVPGAWEAWSRLVDLAALGQDLPGGEPTLVELLQLLEVVGDPAVAEDTFLAELTARTGWLRSDLDTLISAFAPAFPDGWRDGRVLRALVDVFALIGRLGVSAAEADRWATADIATPQAEELRLAAKSKHDEERWPAVARALRDPVRDAQRAALVAFLIAREEQYADEEDLFSDLLIDVEMTSCMLTSRLKQAISSVQLFVQRAFLNLEDRIELTRDDARQWEWMKNYRVWEAARKVFLYPENWIEPELRPDKSPLFERLQNTLLEGELDDAAAEEVYTEYLEGLLKVARMEVMGLYHQLEEDEDGRIDVLHVVARTKSQPHEYYYRQWMDAREWSAWEKLDAEIEGDHLVLAVRDRRLFLFWPKAVQKAQSSSDPNVAPSVAPRTVEFIEIKLAWMERMNEQWSAPHLSTEPLVVDETIVARPNWEAMAHDFFLRLGTGSELVVECHRSLGLDLALRVGTFTIDSCTGLAQPAQVIEDGHELIAPSDAMVKRMRLAGITVRLQDGSPYFPPSPIQFMAATYDAAGNATSDVEEVSATETIDRAWDYVYPAQYGEFASQHGVFLDDEERTFHVSPARRWT